MRSLERVNIRTNERTYSHTYVRDRPYIPSTTLLHEGIKREKTNVLSNDIKIILFAYFLIFLTIHSEKKKSFQKKKKKVSYLPTYPVFFKM